MNIVEKIKIEEKIYNALPVSIKFGWRWNDANNAIQDEYCAFIGSQNLWQKNWDQFYVN